MAELTVIVPVYNGARHLEATLDSIARQDADLEVLVVDDGSKDGSAEIARRHEVGARLLTQSNLGVAGARNRGLAEATSRHVTFLDQDDLWHNTHARTLMDALRLSGAKAVAARERSFALESDRAELLAIGDGRVSWPEFWISDGTETDLIMLDLGQATHDPETIEVERFLGSPQTVTTSIIYERTAAITAGGCCPVSLAMDDHIMNVNVARMFGPISRLGGATVFYRVHPAATTNSSPLAAPYLTMLVALRHGRALPAATATTGYVEHLLRQLPDSSLTKREQLALLTLVAQRQELPTWWARWMKSTVRKIASRH